MKEKPFDPAARRATDEELRRDDRGVVQHEQVSRPEQVGQIAENLVGNPAVRAVEHHKPRKIPTGQRLLGYQPFVKSVVKIV